LRRRRSLAEPYRHHDPYGAIRTCPQPPSLHPAKVCLGRRISLSRILTVYCVALILSYWPASHEMPPNCKATETRRSFRSPVLPQTHLPCSPARRVCRPHSTAARRPCRRHLILQLPLRYSISTCILRFILVSRRHQVRSRPGRYGILA
jgi:hypothetical protein